MPSKRFLLVIFAISLILFSCSSRDKPILQIGMNVEFPPFGYKVDGAFAGIDVDIAHKIAEKMDHPYEIINLEFENIIPAITRGDVDFAISAMSITEERSRILEFSQAYFQVDQVVIVPVDSELQIENITDIGRYRVGVLSGSTAQILIQEELLMKDLIPREELVTFASNTDAMNYLMDGKIDMIVNDDVVVHGFGQNYPIKIAYSIETGEEYGIAMPKDGEYNSKIKAALQDLIISGELKSIMQTHGF